MNRLNIQNEVRQVHKEIWKQKELLWPGTQPTALGMLEPDAAAYLFGFDYQKFSDLGSNKFTRVPRIAGLIDRQAKKIAISTEYPDHVQRFTGAHEIGHLMLHDGLRMHRDRPLDGSPTGPKSQVEQEADYFAACFLIPPNLLLAHFEFQFGCKGTFRFTDTTAFHLNQNDPETLLFASKDSLDREFALARREYFGGRQLISLAKQFRVSETAMALRIKELKLVEWP